MYSLIESLRLKSEQRLIYENIFWFDVDIQGSLHMWDGDWAVDPHQEPRKQVGLANLAARALDGSAHGIASALYTDA